MPTYEYSCNKCGHLFEHFQKMTDEPLKVCPECSGNLIRLIGGGAGLIFKGSGFYITDYKRKNNSTSSSVGKSNSTKKKDTDSKSDTKTEKNN